MFIGIVKINKMWNVILVYFVINIKFVQKFPLPSLFKTKYRQQNFYFNKKLLTYTYN